MAWSYFSSEIRRSSFSRKYPPGLRPKWMINMLETQILTSNVIIREYRKEDFTQIVEILDEISESHDIYFNKDSWTEWTGLRVIQPGYRRIVLVADIDGKIAGIGLIEFIIEYLDGEAVGYLSNWGVKEGYRDLGIGRLLVEKAINILNSIHADVIKIKVASYPDPSRVIDLVRTVGFEPKYITLEKRLKPGKSPSNERQKTS
jgi:ribosomal protein S18 acetylase RimI-like enzyme